MAALPAALAAGQGQYGKWLTEMQQRASLQMAQINAQRQAQQEQIRAQRDRDAMMAEQEGLQRQAATQEWYNRQKFASRLQQEQDAGGLEAWKQKQQFGSDLGRKDEEYKYTQEQDRKRQGLQKAMEWVSNTDSLTPDERETMNIRLQEEFHGIKKGLTPKRMADMPDYLSQNVLSDERGTFIRSPDGNVQFRPRERESQDRDSLSETDVASIYDKQRKAMTRTDLASGEEIPPDDAALDAAVDRIIQKTESIKERRKSKAALQKELKTVDPTAWTPVQSEVAREAIMQARANGVKDKTELMRVAAEAAAGVVVEVAPPPPSGY